MSNEINTYNSYLQQISEYPLLTLEEELALGELALQGDKEAIDTLVQHNLKLVIKEAKHYAPYAQSLTVLDLIQEGNIGLYIAAQNFDYRKGYRFSTYAVWWIKQTITRSISNNSRLVHLPAHVVTSQRKLNQIKEQYYNNYGEMPTTDYLSAITDLDANTVQLLDDLNRTPLSLDQSYGDAENSPLGDLIPSETFTDPEQAVILSTRKESLMNILNTLDPREKKIICARFGLINGTNSSLDEIGAELGLTHERVRQLEIKALNKLRYGPRKKALLELFA